MARRSPVLSLVLCGLALVAQPAAAAVAPGRVVFPLTAQAVQDGVDLRGLSVGCALPDGRTVFAGVEEATKGIVLVQLLRDGSLDPSFGKDGIAHLPAPTDVDAVGAFPFQVLRQDDGRLTLVAEGPTADRFETPRAVFVRLTASGAPDRTYGKDGVAQPGIQGSGGAAAAISPDGAITFTGATGRFEPFEPGADSEVNRRWVAARLTTDGRLDDSFGRGGVAELPGRRGSATALLPDGGAAVVGADATGTVLARLTTAGRVDPAFNGGSPVRVAAGAASTSVTSRADGTVLVLAAPFDASEPAAVRRYLPDGSFDAGFGDRGVVALPGGDKVLLDDPAGSVLVVDTVEQTPSTGARSPGVRLARIVDDGSVTGPVTVSTPFGGGIASFRAVEGPPGVGLLGPLGYQAGKAIVRPDGSVAVPGVAGVVRYTGEGTGYRSEQAAVTSISPSFVLDPAFGGPQEVARLTVRVSRQRASVATSRRFRRISLLADVSGPGLAEVRIKAGRRVIAHSVAPVFGRGRQRLSALLTRSGQRYLRHRHRVRVTVDATFGGVLTTTATARASGTLR